MIVANRFLSSLFSVFEFLPLFFLTGTVMAEAQKKLSDSTEKVSVESDLLQVFNKFDTNSDGKICMSELGVILDLLGSKSSPEEVKNMMTEIDSDGNGFVDLKEFEAFYLASGGKDTTDQELRDAFDLYDKDKNGKICVNELLSVLKSLGEKCSVRDCRKMIRSVDVDGDGCVNFEEFKKMMAGT